MMIVGLNGNESEPEWYIAVRKGHELTRRVLTPPQTYTEKVRHTPHNIKHHRAAVLVNGYKVSVEILHLQSLYLVKGESGQKNIIVSMTDLEHKLSGNEHVPYRLYGDYQALMDEFHSLMK